MLRMIFLKTSGMRAYRSVKSEMNKLGMEIETVSEFHFIARIPGVMSKSFGLGPSKKESVMDLYRRIRNELMERCGCVPD